MRSALAISIISFLFLGKKMQSNFYGTLTPSTPNYTVSTGFVSSVYDAVGKQNITVQSGASLAFLGAIGNNTLTLHGNAAEWQVLRDGSTAIFIHSNGDRIEIPAILDAQTIIFADTSAQLIINTSGQTATVNLGTQTLTTSASALSAWDNTSQVGGTAQAPWSLVMSATVHVNNGSKTSSQAMTFVSDGTAQGSDYLSTALGSGFTTTADLSKAIYWNSNGLYSTDGSLSGTVTLSNTANLQLTPVVLNNQIALLSTANNAPGLVTDGTLAGTQESTLAFGYWYRTVDTQNSVIWTVANSLPYGYELAKISVGNHGLESTMVKDINPGSSSSNPKLNVILPNGKLIFRADDGVHGAEPWVSDGSAAGTFMLADFYGSSGQSSPSQFTAFGTKVAFTANIFLSGSKANSYYGQELAFTDGTVAGTTFLDIYAGSSSSSPTILGVVGNQLYFTATAPNASNVVTQGIYSTDGTTFTRLADITANAALLGWTSSMAYFQATDSLHGSELWAVALDGSSALTLTKDLLSGIGSGLPNSTSAFILNGKLLFNAYTSASAQGFFVSDGSTNGTLQLGESAAINHVTIGNTLIFTDSQGVHAVDLSTALPTAITLATGAYSAPSTGSLQSDSNQAFFVTPTGDLYASAGSLAQTTLLASHVGKFKVLQENALYFIQQTNTTLSLWYSDGTGAGTHYIEDLPTSSLSDYNLDSAVAVRSPGTPAPADITAPSLLAAVVNGALLTLSYTDSHSLDSSHAPLASAFTLTGTSATVTSVTVNATQKTISLTLSAAVASNDVLSLSYTDPSSGNDVNAIQDIAGNDAASIVQRAVSNTTADTLAPVFATASVNGNTLVMTYTDNSALDTSQLPLATAFSLSGTSATVTSVTVNAEQKTVSLTLSAEVTSNDVLSLSYTDPSSGNDVNAIQDIAGNDALSITQTSVTNNTVADTVAPSFVAAVVNGVLLTLSYTDSHSLDSSHAPLASAFTLTGTSATVTSVTVNAEQKTISLTLSAAVTSNDVLSLSYTDPSSGNDVNAIQDIAGNDAASIVQRAVSNTTADTLAPVFATASVNGNTLVMTYTDGSVLDASHVPLATAFTLTGTSATVTSVTVNAEQKTISLTLSAEVTSNDVLSLSYTDPSAGNDINAIQDIAGNDALSITPTSVTNNTVADTVAPSFVAAVVNGALLTLSYTDSHSLDSSHAPLASAFTLTGTSATVTSVTVNAEQKTISLTLSAAVTSNDVLSLSYTDPSSGNDVNAIQDIAGNDAASIVQRAVSNTTADTLAPVFATASVNGNTLVMTYTDGSVLDASHVPLATAFTLTGTSATVTSVTVNATQKTVSLTLSAAVTSNDVLSISYTDPSAGNDVNAIQDAYGNDALSIATQAVVNNTLAKVAWTLLMKNDAVLYSSDGTPDGTGAISSNGPSNAYQAQLIVNGDQSKAIYTLPTDYKMGYAYLGSVFGTDGTTAGTVKLGDNIPVSTPYVFGNTFALLGSNTDTSLITDGTLLGSHTLTTNLSSTLKVDYTAKTLWSANTSAPYGTELYRTVLSDTGATTVMVKDINPGSSYSYPVLGVILPNGKLIFSADDGVHDAEPWVSDGSAAGTFMLADLWDDSYIHFTPLPRQFTAFGTKVAFTAVIYNEANSYGHELAFTDGTVAGTTYLDIYPGSSSSSPTILGVVGNQLYFTATAPNASNVVTQGIYSTDGTTFTRLADIGSSGESLLALTSSIAYFKVSDSVHGEELWAANLTTHSFALVKDILLGSGSALAATSSFSVANQLAFTAYTSDTAQGFFISDGTDSGTVQIGNSLPTSHVTIGNTLVFADSQGVHALSLGNSTPVVKDLTNSVSTLLSNDLDQAFFLTAAKGLYVSDGTVTTQLASNITQFKVVAENAIYAIQDTNGLASLWFSDGTVSGTHAIENLANSASSYDMANAVAIKTVGLWDVPV